MQCSPSLLQVESIITSEPGFLIGYDSEDSDSLPVEQDDDLSLSDSDSDTSNNFEEILLSQLQNEDFMRELNHSPSPLLYSPILPEPDETLSSFIIHDESDDQMNHINKNTDKVPHSELPCDPLILHMAQASTNSDFIPPVYSYKLVGDNIDKDIKPRNMRIDHHTKSLHYML